jgi:hypothetical protein
VWGGETPLTSADAQFISSSGVAILLIDSPNQRFGDPTGDAQTAIARAQSLGVPSGTAIFRDVEAESPITESYILSYYSAFQGSRYVPGFYENPNGGSDQPFNSQYCAAVQNNSVIGSVPLWSSSPEKYSYTPYASQDPAWIWGGFPGTPSCANNTVAWQYLERGVGDNWPGDGPNVDVDEFNAAYSRLLWDGPLSPGPYTPVGPGAYTALQPFRVCDTRSGSSTECSGSPLGQGQTMTFPVTGVTVGAESVPSGAQSVVLNVTAISGTAGTFLTVFPAGSAVPTASNLNVNAQTNQANLVVVALGSGGEVSIYNSQGSINVAVDVQGYFAAPSGSSPAGLYHPTSPLRICDTRAGTGTACSGTSTDNLLGQGQWTKVMVSGCPTGTPSCTASVPTTNGTAEAVALNLTAVFGSAGTFLSVVPPNSSDDLCPTGPPAFSNLNVNAGDNLPNRVIVPLGPKQDVCVYNSQGSINFILDVNGWFGNGEESAQGASYYAVPSLRICDTRSAPTTGYTTECSGDTLGSGQVLPIQVAGIDGLPAVGASPPPVAVIANVTAVDGTAGTFFTLYPASGSAPVASDLNVAGGQNRANLVIVGLSAGDVDLYNALGTINAIVDVEGWFA